MMMTKHRVADLAATTLFWILGLGIVALLAWFIGYIMWEGLPILTWEFITSPPNETGPGGGVGPELFNSFYILILSLLFSIPIGLGAGIYLAEYAKPTRLTWFIRVSTESLASVPSIVLGLFGLIIFVNYFGWGFSILAGAATLSLLNLPVLVRVTEESLRAVPQSYREASLALGGSQWQTIARAVLPSALPGLVSGIILTAGRALGETAILIFTAGTSVSRYPYDLNPFAAGETLAVHLWYVRAEGLVPDADRIAAGSAALLVLMVLFFNLLVGLTSRWLQRRLQGDQSGGQSLRKNKPRQTNQMEIEEAKA